MIGEHVVNLIILMEFLESVDDEDNAEKRNIKWWRIRSTFDEVMDFVINTGTTSVSSIQRKFSVGFNRAARIMDQMEEQGIVSPMQNGKREIFIASSRILI